MSNFSWDKIDKVNSVIKSRYNESSSTLPIQTAVKFTKNYEQVTAGTKAIIVDKQGDYYALSVKGNYIEGVHKSFIAPLKKKGV